MAGRARRVELDSASARFVALTRNATAAASGGNLIAPELDR